MFRLPGQGGAAMLLRTVIVPGPPGGEAAVLAFDVGFLSPVDRRHHQAVPAGPGFVDRLSAFFFAAANEFHPEHQLPPFVDDVMGLRVSVTSSDDAEVGIEAVIASEPGAEPEGIDFVTSRTALATAAQEVRALTAVSERDGCVW